MYCQSLNMIKFCATNGRFLETNVVGLIVNTVSPLFLFYCTQYFYILKKHVHKNQGTALKDSTHLQCVPSTLTSEKFKHNHPSVIN